MVKFMVTCAKNDRVLNDTEWLQITNFTYVGMVCRGGLRPEVLRYLRVCEYLNRMENVPDIYRHDATVNIYKK